MSAAGFQRGRAVRRAPGLGRRAFFVVVAALLLACLLADPPPAGGQEPPLADAVPTWWHEAAGLTPLLTAPPPPNPATICLIDTGVTPTPDLDITARWAYDGGTLDDVHATEESPGHGTLVAHFAAGAVNGWGGAGAFPHARISSVRVFPREGGARWQDYIRGITRCLKLDTNTKVIVISLGGQQIDPGEADELEAHIEQTRNLYAVNVVAAAGNGGGRADFPARFGAAFAVAGAQAGGELCDFSARGEEVDIAAPGCDLSATGWNAASWNLHGTSFAAPLVAGALAALRSYVPSLSPVDAERALVAAARSANPPSLDVAAALRVLGTRFPQATPEVARLDEAAVVPDPRRTASSPLPVRLPRPRLLVRRSRGGVILVARNRPRAATLEVRLGARGVSRRSARLRVRTNRKAARARFTSRDGVSPWTPVRW